MTASPELSGRRLLREIREFGCEGCYSVVTDVLRTARPARPKPFETPPGRQAQVDFAEFRVEFDDGPGVIRKVWLLTIVLGRPR